VSFIEHARNSPLFGEIADIYARTPFEWRGVIGLV
jgi:hypothetical protein